MKDLDKGFDHKGATVKKIVLEVQPDVPLVLHHFKVRMPQKPI